MKLLYECPSCNDAMEDLTAYHTINGGVRFSLSHKEDAYLYVCTSRDCKDRGIVRCLPSEPKDD